MNILGYFRNVIEDVTNMKFVNISEKYSKRIIIKNLQRFVDNNLNFRTKFLEKKNYMFEKQFKKNNNNERKYIEIVKKGTKGKVKN